MHEREILPEVGWEQRQLEITFDHARMLQNALNQCVDDKTAKALREFDIPEINKAFPYFMQGVHISGKGIFPYANEEGVINEEGWGYSEGNFGVHRGFSVLCISTGEHAGYHVMQKICIGESFDDTLSTVSDHREVFQYNDLDSQLIPVLEMAATFGHYELSDMDLSERLQLVKAYSKELVDLLSSTTFRRMKHRQQRRVVDDLLIEADKHTSIRGLEFTCEPQYAYAPLFAGKIKHFVPLVLETSVITGTCLGIDSIETGILHRKAIRNDKDLADKTAGLCVVIDPDPDTRKGLSLVDEQVLYIPFDQQFDAVLYEAS